MSTVKIVKSLVKKIDFMILPNNQRKTIQQVFSSLKEKPDFIINATFYNMANGETIVYSEDNNKSYGYTWSKEGMGIIGDKSLVWTDTKEAYQSDNIHDFIGGCPTLVKDGKKYVNSGSTSSTYIMNQKHYRSWVGWNDDALFLSYSKTKLDVNNMAEESIRNGCKYAINLDGGGSTCIGKNTNGKLQILSAPSGYRANASWLLVYLNEPAPAPTPTKPSTTTIVKSPISVDRKTYQFNTISTNGKTYVQLRDFQQAGYSINYVNNVPTMNKPQTKLGVVPNPSRGNICIDNVMYSFELKYVNNTTYFHIRQLEKAGYGIDYTTLPIVMKP